MPPWKTGAGGRGQAEDADEDEDELLEYDLPNVRDTVLWLIDAGPKMHDTLVDDITSEGTQISLFHQALRAAFSFQRSKLVNSPADHCGILLFNTRESRVQDAGKNVAYPNSLTLQSITQVAVPPTSELKDELQTSFDEGPSYFRKKYAPNDKQSRIHHAFGNAEAMLFNSGKAGSKRIFFVTNEDNPMAEKKGRTEQQRLALEKVKSMARRGIEFEPFLISTDEHAFDTAHFYADMFGAYADDEGDFNADSALVETDVHRPWNATTKFENLEGGVEARETPKRVIFSVPMHVADGLTIGVKGYCTLVKASKGLAVRVKAMEREDEDDPLVFKEVVVETALTCVDTGRELDKERDVDTAFSFGTENSIRAKVRFSKSEVRKMRSFGQTPSIRILGFKPASELQFHENTKHSYFIYPSDTQWQNSQRAFGALLNSMAKKGRIALAMFCPRGFVIPVFAAILPQLEERGPEGQIEPPGMHVIPLPYADDIREAPAKHCENQKVANKTEIEAAEKLVKSFTRNAAFNPDFFPNPSLVHHYKVLLAVAFGDEIDGDWVDETLPKYDKIRQRSAMYVQLLNETVDGDERVTGGGAVVASGTESGARAPKRSAAFGHNDEPMYKRLHRENELGSEKVAMLKSACEYYSLSTSGLKAELVQRVSDHMTALAAKSEAE